VPVNRPGRKNNFRHELARLPLNMRVSRFTFARLAVISGLIVGAGMAPPAFGAYRTPAVSANDFLDSIGVCVHVQHGQKAWVLAPDLKYLGVRAIRDGADGNFNLMGLLLLHREAGVRVVFGPGSGARDRSLLHTIEAGRALAAAGALLAIEGPNEPNNFGGVTYQGQNSNAMKSWLPVAHYQRDLYRAVQIDPVLRSYPVYGPSECGAESDNAGLQFLSVPKHAHTLMPAGTRFADDLNCHNYVCGHIDGIIDNQATFAAAVRPPAAIDDLFGNHGLTWLKHFHGYTEDDLETIPKVTTETGWKTDGTAAGDDRQGKMLLNVFLAQYKAHWSHTFVYELTDDADGAFGFYHADLTTPRKAADYLHNFTTILADTGSRDRRGRTGFFIPHRPATVHDLLLQKSDGTFELAVWGERVNGASHIVVDLYHHRAHVKIYDPTVGPEPVQTLDDIRKVPLTVSDHALILEFR
jgi:hypothetical protein